MSAQSSRSSSAIALFAAALLLFVVGSLVAWWQPPRLFPLEPQTTVEWWLQPLEQNAFQRMPRIGGSLRDVFVVPNTGEVWAVGRWGLIVHSRDQGRTWQQAAMAGDTDKQPDLKRIVFTADGSRGWAVGESGTILTTVDGGAHWAAQASGSGTGEMLTGVAFAADGSRGWAVGWNGTILTTADGGAHWAAPASGSEESLGGVAFAADGSRGWAVGDNGTILTTADGGAHWAAQASGTGKDLYGVAFAADGSRGWAVGGSGTILTTADGGAHWAAQASGTGERLFGVAFAADGSRGWAVGESGTILTTADGGAHWAAQASGTGQGLHGVAFAADGSRGWAVGTGGTILTTADGGAHWTAQASGSEEWLYGVAFAADGSRGWAVGIKGTILTTADGGAHWAAQASGTGQGLTGVAFAADGSRGWAVGGGGTILTTADGGAHWAAQSSGTGERLFGVAFAADGSRGWAVGESGTILTTADGGAHWAAQASGSGKWLSGVAFAADGSRGWAVGINGTILTTADGGAHWAAQASGTKAWLNGVAFAADGSRGWAVGNNGTILTTADGGAHWAAPASGTKTWLTGVAFAADGSRGWSVGDNGTILATADGGAHWAAQTSGTGQWLYGVAFAADGSRGIAVGDRLTILTTTNGGKTWSPVEYHRYPAPWYFLVLLLSLILAGLGSRRPQPKTLSASVADVLASDRPLEAGDADALGYAEIAAGLSRFLRNPKTLPPLTLAITGEWGSGKSSLMNLVKADLRQAGFRTVWFNAWHHQKGEQLLASLFANLRAQAIPSWFSRAGGSFRWKLLYRRSQRHAVLLLALAVLLSFGVGYLAKDFQHCRQVLASGDWASLNLQSVAALSPLLGGVVVGLVALYNGMKGFGLDPAKLMASVTAGGDTLKPLEPGARYQFAKEFADVTEALAPGRLVIFIDDLDRCSKENVLEVLESVNFLVSSGGCFVVLGMARAWVETCVGLSFKELAEEHNDGADDKAYRIEFARKYLQKLINIEVPVPKLDADDSSRLMPVKQDLPEPGNRLNALTAAAWAWLAEVRHLAWIGLLLLAGLGLGQWLAPEIGGSLDWVGGQLQKSAAKPKPVEIPLPAAMEVKLGADGGLALGLTDPAHSAKSPLLLRADPAELDKGVVLGKLGGAELVLKRPAAVAPKSKETDKPVEPKPNETVEPKPKPEPKTDNAPSFTPGASEDGDSLWHIGPPSLTGLLLLGLGLALLLRSPVKLTEDSDTFMEALNTWHPLIAASCPTPRMVKRYLNWVRFLAMRYRPAEPETAGILTRLGRRFGFVAKPAKPAKPMNGEGKGFDEDILVALSAIYQLRRSWVIDPKKFGTIRDGKFEFLLTDEPAETSVFLIDILMEPMDSLTPEDWQRAAEQRERFLAAIGDVDVA